MICITFDTDHMRPRDMATFTAMLGELMPGRGTIFMHEVFEELFDLEHELAPHPLIEDLRNWDADLVRLQRRIPRPVNGVRPHSCVFSHLIGTGLEARGYTSISQTHCMHKDGIVPLRHPWGIWELPIYYMDSMDFWMCKNWPALGHEPFAKSIIDLAVGGDSLYVFDFHPLHIALNSASHESYQAAKPKILGADPVSPFTLAGTTRGTRDFFVELCSAMKSHGIESRTMTDALASFIARQSGETERKPS